MPDHSFQVPYWLNMLVACIGTAFGGALLVGVPLLLKLTRLRTEVKQDNLNIDRQRHDQDTHVKIDARWEELVEARVDELARLQLRDEQQARQIAELFEKHVKCAQQEAVLNERNQVMNEKITSLETRLAERDRLYAALEERFKSLESKM